MMVKHITKEAKSVFNVYILIVIFIVDLDIMTMYLCEAIRLVWIVFLGGHPAKY